MLDELFSILSIFFAFVVCAYGVTIRKAQFII